MSRKMEELVQTLKRQNNEHFMHQQDDSIVFMNGLVTWLIKFYVLCKHNAPGKIRASIECLQALIVLGSLVLPK